MPRPRPRVEIARQEGCESLPDGLSQGASALSPQQPPSALSSSLTRHISASPQGGSYEELHIVDVDQSSITALSQHFAKHPISASEARQVSSGLTMGPPMTDDLLRRVSGANRRNRGRGGGRNNVSDTQRSSFWNKSRQRKLSNREWASRKRVRDKLPVTKHMGEIVTLMRTHSVIIVSGSTGCGKSTQIPQFILDDPVMGPSANIICTQPRRVSAVSVCVCV